MRSYNILALTDHSTHSASNSIYLLMRELKKDPRSKLVDVASRSVESNSDFFDLNELNRLYVKRIEEDFKFTDDARSFREGLRRVDFADYDLILMRLPPSPRNRRFLRGIRNNHNKKVFINDPLGILECGGKEFLLKFQELCPPMKFCKTENDIKLFAEKFPIVLKPINQYGGKGIFRVIGDKVDDGKSEMSLDDFIVSHEVNLRNHGYLAMKFLSNVSQGDKRLIVVDGRIVAASVRYAPKGKWISNFAEGGSSFVAFPDDREKQIVKTIDSVVKDKGILIYGVDTMVDDDGNRVLSEINVTSLGGIHHAHIHFGQQPIDNIINSIFRNIDEHLQYTRH